MKRFIDVLSEMIRGSMSSGKGNGLDILVQNENPSFINKKINKKNTNYSKHIFLSSNKPYTYPPYQSQPSPDISHKRN